MDITAFCAIIIAVITIVINACTFITAYIHKKRREKLVPPYPRGYECFHCGQYAVHWSGDFDFSDYGEEGEGIIHECHCSNCGADVTYRVPIDNGEESEDEEH